jgi:hypothetical protein
MYYESDKNQLLTRRRQGEEQKRREIKIVLNILPDIEISWTK